jgi:hypothetical protein
MTSQAMKKTLWEAADKLRAQMDAAEYKRLVLGLIFLKYVSDAFTERQREVARLLGPGGAGSPPKNRVPNKITCSTVLPNGRTVGSYVQALSNQINIAGNQSVSTPNGPASAYTPGLSPLSIPGAAYSGTNFRQMFGGSGANYAFLGDAGNFAYAAVSANMGVPL